MEIDDFTFEKLKEFIEAQLEFSITYYNNDYLRRRIKSRMRRTNCQGLDEYFRLIRNDTDEQENLLRSFSINVTGFFRNQEVWECIRRLLRSMTSEMDECSVWSAGCADGREPYSVSLLAHSDSQIDADAVEVVGTDINGEALDKARKGWYTNTITNDIDDQLGFLVNPYQYLERDGDSIYLNDVVKQTVKFENHDLIRDDPVGWYDLVLCRNVLIYLKRSHERDIFETITSAVNEGGYVVIGKAETMPTSLTSMFKTVNPALRVYQYIG